MLNRWKTKQLKLGKIKVRRKQKLIFQAIEELPEIRSMQSSCGCSVPIYDKTRNQIIVNYIPGSIPQHLKSQNFYSTTKTITVTYADGTKDILSFTARVYQKL